MQRVYFKASSNELQFISNAITQFQSCINYKTENESIHFCQNKSINAQNQLESKLSLLNLWWTEHNYLHWNSALQILF